MEQRDMPRFEALCEDRPISRRVPPISRRGLLGAGLSFFGWMHQPRQASAAGSRDPRFLTVILRGALDGLAAVAPVGDPDYAALRAGIALQMGGDAPALTLDGFFALHPAMKNFARLYAAKQASIIHASATAYRERSHFDGQDVLETGLGGVGSVTTGWLNRAIAAMPKGERIAAHGGLAIGTVTPIILRGPAPVLGWTPQRLADAPDDLARRVIDLYVHSDPILAKALSAGVQADLLARGGAANANGGGNPAIMAQAASGAARLMRKPDGPRVAVLSFDGWDTHANQGGARGRLAELLGGLDAACAAFEREFAEQWRDCVILIVTEFGRTAKINGTEGSDHGTATVAMLVGGAVKGGRIVADWPGLKPNQLHEGRDLRPTTDLRGAIKGVLTQHLGLSPQVLASTIFPDSALVKPIDGLIV